MGMEKEWEELKAWAQQSADLSGQMTGLFLVHKMTELEKRSLPERVADLLEKIDWCKNPCHIDVPRALSLSVSRALRTGDVRELQMKWVK